MRLKDIPVKIKAGPDDGLDEGQFSAYASVFGNVDAYGDRVAKGAFANTLKEWEESGNPIPVLFGHNLSDPDFNLGHVMSAEEDDRGLKVTAQLDLENPKAVQTYRMLKGGRVNQMSFAYDVLDEGESEDDGGTKANDLRDLKLYEVSVVTIGANQETEVLAVKTAAVALASAAKAGRVLSAQNETALREARDAIDAVLSSLDSTDDQEKANGETAAKSGASDEEPAGAKSSASDEEPSSSPSARVLAAQRQLELTKGAP